MLKRKLTLNNHTFFLSEFVQIVNYFAPLFEICDVTKQNIILTAPTRQAAQKSKSLVEDLQA